MGKTLFRKIWDDHVVEDLGDDFHLLHVDRHLVHDGGAQMLVGFEDAGFTVRNPELTFATPDHTISTTPGRADTFPVGVKCVTAMRRETAHFGIRLFDVGQPGQGIVHVIGPELGLSLPGALVVCGDSHTCTHGGVGAMAFGIGSTEFRHVAATQTVVQQVPKTMRITLEGSLATGVTAKDMILHVIGRLGAAAGSGYAVEYAGSAVRALDVEGRLTLCNLSIELGAKIGMVAPDDKTFDYLHGRPYCPTGTGWDEAVAYWRSLPSDLDATFDREETIDVSSLKPQITWGTSPEHVVAIDGMTPDPDAEKYPVRRQEIIAALDYMGLTAAQPMRGVPVDWVFIGSCTNSRMSDLRAAAGIVRGQQVHPSVTAWVVPGSENVKRQAEAEGLAKVFIDAGFHWRDPGCSLCLAANNETVPRGKRSVSTSNRNFVGRQGPGARTHLASPAMAALAALRGQIADFRDPRT